MASPYKHMDGRQLEQAMFDSLLRYREARILQLLFGETEGTEEDIRSLTEGMDVDTESLYYMLLLAVYGHRTQWRYFPPRIIPRLKGIHRYHQTHNLMGLPWLLEKVRILRDADIPVMLIKGLAMRLRYAPGIPRIMNDYDIVVPQKRFDEAMELLQGDDVEGKISHYNADTLIVDCPFGKMELEVHKWIYKRTQIPEDELWERAIPITIRDVDMLVLSPEDCLVHQLDTCSRAFVVSELLDNQIKAFVDCHMICDTADLDPDVLISTIHRFRVEHSSRLMVSMFTRLFPGDSEPLKAILDELPITESYAEWLRWGLMLRDQTTWMSKRGYLGDKDYRFTPENLIRGIARTHTEYRFYKTWYGRDKRVSSYLSYMLWSRGIDSFETVKDRYLHRFFPGNDGGKG